MYTVNDHNYKIVNINKKIPYIDREHLDITLLNKVIKELTEMDDYGKIDRMVSKIRFCVNYINKKLPKEYNSELKILFYRNLFYTFTVPRQHEHDLKAGDKYRPLGHGNFIAGLAVYKYYCESRPDYIKQSHKTRNFANFSSWKLVLFNKEVQYKNGTTVSLYVTTWNKHIASVMCGNIANYSYFLNKSKAYKWLPKYTIDRKRTKVLIGGKNYKITGDPNKDKFWIPAHCKWFKLNGQNLNVSGSVKLYVNMKKGTKIKFPKKPSLNAEIRMIKDLNLVKAICAKLNITPKEYNRRRSVYLSGSVDKMISQGTINRFAIFNLYNLKKKHEFMKGIRYFFKIEKGKLISKGKLGKIDEAAIRYLYDKRVVNFKKEKPITNLSLWEVYDSKEFKVIT